MTDSIGVLGASTTLTVGTHIIYTAGTGKAAKFQIFFLGQANASGTTLTITVNGVNVMTHALTGNDYVWSTSALLLNESATAPDGTTIATTAAPFNEDYYASVGDLVQYTIASNAMQSLSIQVVGTEIDV